MKKINKKLISSIILGLILYTPVTNVHAAELNDGAIKGSADNYGSYRTEDSGIYTYDFQGASQLNITDNSNENYGIGIYTNSGLEQIKIVDKLDININKNNNNTYNFDGIIISPTDESNKIIDRSAGGNITIESINPGSMATFRGAAINILRAPGMENKILLGDSDIKLNVVDAENGIYLYGLYIDSMGSGGSNNQIVMGNGKMEITGNLKSGGKNNTQGIGMLVFYENTITTGDVSVDIKMTNEDNTLQNINVGIDAEHGGKVITDNGDINVYGNGGSAVYNSGVFAYDGGEVTKTGGNITAIAEGEGTLAARGVFARGGTIDVGISDVITQAIGGSIENNNVIESIGLVSLSDGLINYAGGTITATADNKDAYVAAVLANSGGNININKGTNNKVIINGNVDNLSTGAIFLNLNTADSVLNGGVYDANGTFNLANSAQWNVLGESTVNNFNVDNGIITVILQSTRQRKVLILL